MILLLLALVGQVFAFNYDLDGASIFHNDNGYFGYSVFLHSTGSENLVLVGSPDSQTDEYLVENAGTVFKCPIPAKNSVQTEVISCSERLTAVDTFGNILKNTANQPLYGEGKEQYRNYWNFMKRYGL